MLGRQLDMKFSSATTAQFTQTFHALAQGRSPIPDTSAIMERLYQSL
jgi:hypothetical protein